MQDDCKRGELGLFLAYAFMIPFICIGLMKCVSSGNTYGIISFILYGIEGATPTIAAVIVIRQKNGLKGLKQFLGNKYKNHLNIKLCILGFCLPGIILTIGKLGTYFTPYHNQFITGMSIRKLIIIMWALIAEELGWRGYLQEKLESRFDAVFTPLIVGIIWAVWHYHFFISGSMQVPIILFSYSCIAESYGYFVITKLAKGNIMPASLWHFSRNLFFNLYRLNPNWNSGSVIPYIIVNSVYTLYWVLFAWYIRARKYGSNRPQDKSNSVLQ